MLTTFTVESSNINIDSVIRDNIIKKADKFIVGKKIGPRMEPLLTPALTIRSCYGFLSRTT